MKITVATMDRAIRAAVESLGSDWDESALRNRVIYLRGLEDAAKVEASEYANWLPARWCKEQPKAIGHDAHVEAIRDLVRAIRKEMGR